MGRRLLGAVLFLVPAMLILQTAGRLAAEGRDGWGWFLMAGCAGCGVSLNVGVHGPLLLSGRDDSRTSA